MAMLAEPEQPWRIVTSDRHSTVWDGDGLLFDHNFLALSVSPVECLAAARWEGEELEPGEYVEVNFASHYSKDKR